MCNIEWMVTRVFLRSILYVFLEDYIKLILIFEFKGITVTTGNSDLVWGVEAEGDDEGDDESDEEKGDDGVAIDNSKNDFDTLHGAKTVAMVEMEVEVFPCTNTTNNDSDSLTDIKRQLIALPCAEGKLPVPISNLNSQKLSPVIIRC